MKLNKGLPAGAVSHARGDSEGGRKTGVMYRGRQPHAWEGTPCRDSIGGGRANCGLTFGNMAFGRAKVRE